MPQPDNGADMNIQFGASDDAPTRQRADTQSTTTGKKKKKKARKKVPGPGSNVMSERTDSTGRHPDNQLNYGQRDPSRDAPKAPAQHTAAYDQAQNHQLPYIQGPPDSNAYVPIAEESEDNQVSNFIENYDVGQPSSGGKVQRIKQEASNRSRPQNSYQRR